MGSGILCGNHIGNGFCLSQVHLVIYKSPLGEFARTGHAGTAVHQTLKQAFDDVL